MTMNPSPATLSLSGVQPDDPFLDRMVERERQRIAAALRLVGRIDGDAALALLLASIDDLLCDAVDGHDVVSDAVAAARWRLRERGYTGEVDPLGPDSDQTETAEDVAA